MLAKSPTIDTKSYYTVWNITGLWSQLWTWGNSAAQRNCWQTAPPRGPGQSAARQMLHISSFLMQISSVGVYVCVYMWEPGGEKWISLHTHTQWKRDVKGALWRQTPRINLVCYICCWMLFPPWGWTWVHTREQVFGANGRQYAVCLHKNLHVFLF